MGQRRASKAAANGFAHASRANAIHALDILHELDPTRHVRSWNMGRGLQETKLVVAESEATVAEDLRLRLTRLGAGVVDVVGSTNAAIDSVGRHQPDLVLMDARLAGEFGGVEATSVIWRRQRIPSVLLVGHSDVDMLRRVSETDSFGYVLKPFDEAELVATLEMALRRNSLERRIEESEKRYAAMLASIGEGVISTDSAGRISFMNPVAEALTDWKLLDAQGLPIDEVLRVEPLEKPEGTVLGVGIELSEPGASPKVATLRARDGSTVPIELIATPISGNRRGQGPALGSVVALRDISQRLQAEQELRDSEQRYRRLFEDMDEGVAINEAVRDGDGHVIDYVILAANPAFEHHSPYTIAAAVGKRATELYQLPSEYIQQWWESHAPLRRPAHTEMWHEPTGQWLHVVASPITDGRFATFFTDITARKRAEEALQHSEQRFRAIFDQTFQFTGLLDVEGTVIEANRTALDFAGISEEEVVGKPFWETIWWAHSSELQARVRKAVLTAAAGQFVRMEATHPGADGSLHTVDFSLKPVRNEDGKVVLLIPEGRDITERKLAEDALRKVEAERRELEARVSQAQKLEAIGGLAAGVAHDFNNLLTVVAGCCDMLLSSETLAAADRQVVEEIQDAGTKAGGLTNQLLAFSRKQVLKPEVVGLHTLVSTVAQLLERLLGEDVEFTLRSEPDLWAIEVDPGQIEQAIINLAVNARDAMPRGGELTIEILNVDVAPGSVHTSRGVARARYVLMSVRDTGTGIPVEVRARIFDPFFTTKEVGKGTGLGLAMVYGIVQQSGGYVHVDSELGRGSCFYLYFPAADGAARETGPVRPRPARDARGTETVLLVEDDQAVRLVTSRALSDSGYTVHEAANAAEALRTFEKHAERIDLIITDVVMPGISGREMVERARSIKPAIRVLYVSGYPDDAILRHGILRGEVAFLQKPFSAAVLTRQVRNVLESPDGLA